MRKKRRGGNRADPVPRVSEKGALGGLRQELNVVGAAGGSLNGSK